MRTQTLSPSSNRLQSVLEQALLAVLLGIGLFIVTAGLVIAGFEVIYLGRIYPGVSVAGIDVGGLSPQAAALKVVANLNYPQDGRIVMQDKDQNWLITPAEMGLVIDPDQSARNAYQIGRSGNLVENLAVQLRASSAGRSVPASFIFDQRSGYDVIASLAAKIDKPVIEASIGLQGTEVVVNSGQTGRTVDIPASLAKVNAQIQSLQDGVIPLVITETAPVIIDAQTQADLARRILSQPLTLSMPGDQPDKDKIGPWTFDPPTLAAMLIFERVQDVKGPRYQIALNSQLLGTYLTNLAPDLQLYPANARFTFNDDTRQLDLIQPAVIGRTLDVTASINKINAQLLKGQHSVELAFLYSQPPVVDSSTADSLGIHELIRAQTSFFRGSSAARVQNIRAAAASFHGLMVAPGETFSMANALGNISLDNGYAEALIIVGDQTIKGVGGGVCQVSTTLFRTAFFAGYPIVERHAHAYRVGYYEQNSSGHDPDLAGLDATVFVPLVDFKFVNDTPYWLLMETYVNASNSTITWKFYSTSDGRSVDWSTTGTTNVVPSPDPLYKENPDLSKGDIKQVDWAVEGADVNVQRTVNRDGAVYFQDSFFTRYEPWRDIYEYGPGTDVPTPTPR
jgi:vancomycin resistance protein YoaR